MMMKEKYSLVQINNFLKYTLVIFILLFVHKLKAQNDYPLAINYYNFIHYDKNIIKFPGDSTDFEHLFSKIDTLILNGKGKIRIVHIGGSHIQADIYSGRMRERLQTFYPGLNGGRGSVFPYRISKTNTPKSYTVHYTGEWQSCRNVERKKNCTLGLSGIALSTSDTTASITIELKKDSLVSYYFNQIKVFYKMDKKSLQPDFPEMKIDSVVNDSILGVATYYFKKDYQSFKIKFKQTDSIQNRFTLYDITLENDDPGFVYYAMGVNGASFPSFLKCALFENHLKATNPDLVIISLGTNDAYTTRFKPEFYRSNYQKMINRIKKILPNVAIMATVANDSYLFRRYPNKNTQLAQKVIYDVAKKNNCGVWDFYEIMGGFNSSSLWLDNKLMRKDLVHFSVQGYLLKGDLFFNAFIKSYNNYLDAKEHKKTNLKALLIN
jgi:hypothetical protein